VTIHVKKNSIDQLMQQIAQAKERLVIGKEHTAQRLSQSEYT